MRGEGRFTGTRGGKDQFDWDDVKVDADREQYLGHSLVVPVGRWQKGEFMWRPCPVRTLRSAVAFR